MLWFYMCSSNALFQKHIPLILNRKLAILLCICVMLQENKCCQEREKERDREREKQEENVRAQSNNMANGKTIEEMEVSRKIENSEWYKLANAITSNEVLTTCLVKLNENNCRYYYCCECALLFQWNIRLWKDIIS